MRNEFDARIETTSIVAKCTAKAGFMRKLVAWMLFLCFCESVAHASERGILATIPTGYESTQIVGAAKHALMARGWIVEQEDASTIVARFVHPPHRARMRIALIAPNVLAYDNVAERQRIGPPSQSTGSVSITAIPPEWLDGLRKEFLAALSVSDLTLPSWSGR